MNFERNFYPYEFENRESCFNRNEDSSSFNYKETSNFLCLKVDYTIDPYIKRKLFNKHIKQTKPLSLVFKRPSISINYNEQIDESIKNIINFQKDIALYNNNDPAENLAIKQEDQGITNSLTPDENLFVHRRKWSNDSIHKKIKRFFFKYIQNKFSFVLSRKPPKIPQNVISNVTIKFNKYMFNLNIEEFYHKFCDLDIMKLINKKMISGEEANQFSKYMLQDLYHKYIEDQFDIDIDRICNNESTEYYEKIRQKSRKFVDYFLKLEPFQKKQL